MKLTEALLKHLREKHGLAADASDDDARALVDAKMKSGELTATKLAELLAEKEGTPAASKQLGDLVKSSVVDGVTEGMKGLGEIIGAAVGQAVKDNIPTSTKQPEKPDGGDGGGNDGDQSLMDDFKSQIASMTQAAKEEIESARAGSGNLSPSQFLATAADKMSENARVRVKGAAEQYSDTKSAAVYPGKHAFGGAPVEHLGRSLDHPSDRDKAVIGAYFKWAVNRSAGNVAVPSPLKMRDHDWDLLKYALHEKTWKGMIGSDRSGEGGIPVDGTKLSDMQIKALLDSSTSGGDEAVPTVFDDAVILTPLLHGELFPYINTINMARGRLVEGVAISTPSFTSGTAEGTEIGLFDTSDFISELDTTIFPAVGAMEMGLDFLSDSPINIAQIVMQRYGEAALQWLDEQVAVGDGTTEPTGIFTASGLNSINSANGTSGPLTVGDAEGLLFGIDKAHRRAKGGRCYFVGNETTYRRLRAIAVGASDARRVFGMDHESFTLLEYPYKVNENIANNQLAFCNLGFYRMYRRLGMSVRVETGGSYLARRNLELIVLRMRFGGQPELGSAFAVMADAQA